MKLFAGTDRIMNKECRMANCEVKSGCCEWLTVVQYKPRYRQSQLLTVWHFLVSHFLSENSMNFALQSSRTARVQLQRASTWKQFWQKYCWFRKIVNLLSGHGFLIFLYKLKFFMVIFTIVRTKHTPQLIYNSFFDMLVISRKLKNSYTVFYKVCRCPICRTITDFE